MADPIKPDLCILGGGTAGRAVATAARAVGASVVLVERNALSGEISAGRVPSTAFIAASRYAEAGRESSAFGIAFEPPRINFGRIHQHVSDVVAAIAPNTNAERFEGLGVTVVRAEGRFVDKRTVEADGRPIRARRFVVATGSRPAVPPIPGIDSVPFLTERTIFNLTRKPAHLIVIGAGPTGLELAQAHRRLGCEVTVIEAAKPLAGYDPELAEIALRRIVADGVELHVNALISGIASSGNGIAVTVTGQDGSEAISGSHLLVATGRVPIVEPFGLDSAGIRFDETGIRVDASLRTTNRRVYAIGDCAKGSPSAATAAYHAGLVIRSALFGSRARAERGAVPVTIHTDPEIATVGLGEQDALKRYPDKARVLRWPYAENDRARSEHRSDGLVKLITLRNGRILGCAIVGPEASEAIALYACAIANRLKVGGFIEFVAPRPSFAEMAGNVAAEHNNKALTSPLVRGWLAFIRLLP